MLGEFIAKKYCGNESSKAFTVFISIFHMKCAFLVSSYPFVCMSLTCVFPTSEWKLRRSE